MNISEKHFEKQKKILETAYSVFKEKSVGCTAVDDVVKAAGIARGTFYLYFKDKSDLLEHMILFKSTEAMKQLLLEGEKEIRSSGLSLKESMKLYIDKYIDFLAGHKDVLAVLEKNIASCLRMYPDFYDSEAKELFERITSDFTEKGFSPATVHKMIYIIFDMVGSVCSDALLHSKPFSLDEIREDVTGAALSILKFEADKIGADIG